MKSILAMLFAALSAFSAFAAESIGNCSPNAAVLINNVFLCVEGLSAADRKELREIKRELESITAKRPADAYRMNEKLLTLASQGRVHLIELKRMREDFTSMLEKFDVKTDDLKRMISSMLASAQPVPYNPWDAPPPTELDGKPIVTAIPIPQNAKSLPLLISESKCPSLKVADSSQTDLLDLSRLIVGTESMDCSEKQYWFDLLPSMTKKQTDRLYEILDEERQKLEALEIKYQAEIRCLNAKHLFEWNAFAYTKNKGSSEEAEALRLSMYEAAVDSIGACPELPKEIAESLNTLAAEREAIGGSSGKGALILAKYYRSKPYYDPSRVDTYAKMAYRLSADDWDAFSQYLSLLADRNDYKGGYEAIRRAIVQGRLKELKGDSEKAIVRKVALYWQYLYFAEQLKIGVESSDIAIAGYNLSKLLLEKYPSYKYLSEVTFFAGHLSRQLKDRKKLIGEYLDAIADISMRLYSSKVISAEEYSYSSLNISWYCLFAENYKCAIQASRRGIEANPAYVPLYTNLAHGLLLSNKQPDAILIYKKYAGKTVDGKKWEDIIQDDITKLTQYQVGIREFDKVRSIMRGGAG